jgi:hypothetical protein
MMFAPRIQRPQLRLFILALIWAFLQAGCGDDSKTTGTQVQLSEEAKAQIKDMRDMYKDSKVPRRTGRGKKSDD